MVVVAQKENADNFASSIISRDLRIVIYFRGRAQGLREKCEECKIITFSELKLQCAKVMSGLFQQNQFQSHPHE